MMQLDEDGADSTKAGACYSCGNEDTHDMQNGNAQTPFSRSRGTAPAEQGLATQ
jgi:hypothetical protein